MTWFGESWGAPICDPEDHVETPVGQKCIDCDVVIGADDQGVMVPHVTLDEVPSVRPYHLDCWLDHILPHGPDCEHCRGLERTEHKMSCSYAKHGGDCDCPFGDDMRRLLDPKTTLAEVDNIAERMGVSRRRLEDIAARGLDHVERWKRILQRKRRNRD